MEHKGHLAGDTFLHITVCFISALPIAAQEIMVSLSIETLVEGKLRHRHSLVLLDPSVCQK